MTPELETAEAVELAYAEAVQRVDFNFGFKRRSFMQLLGAWKSFSMETIHATTIREHRHKRAAS